MADHVQIIAAWESQDGALGHINQDYCHIRIPDVDAAESVFGAVAIVADGMGGFSKGEIASRVAAETFVFWYYALSIEMSLETRVRSAVQMAHTAVQQRAVLEGVDLMGTTLASVVVLPSGQAAVVNVGDSRVYLLRAGNLEQISRDQAIELPPSDVGGKRVTQLTTYIGQSVSELMPIISLLMLQQGDSLLLCTDGLWSMLDESALRQTLSDNSQVEDAAKHLVQQAVNAPKSGDNVTGVVLQVGKGGKRDSRPKRQERPSLVLPFIALMAVLAGGIIVFLLLSGKLRLSDVPVVTQEVSALSVMTLTSTSSPTADRNATATVDAGQTSTAQVLETNAALTQVVVTQAAVAQMTASQSTALQLTGSARAETATALFQVHATQTAEQIVASQTAIIQVSQTAQMRTNATATRLSQETATALSSITPTPTIPYIIVIAADGVNLRRGDGVDFFSIGTLQQSAQAYVTAVSGNDSNWIRVRTEDGRIGWIRAIADVITINGDLSSLPHIIPATVTPIATVTSQPTSESTEIAP